MRTAIIPADGNSNEISVIVAKSGGFTERLKFGIGGQTLSACTATFVWANDADAKSRIQNIIKIE